VPWAGPESTSADSASFASPDGWTVALVGRALPQKAAPGGVLRVMLAWQASGPARRDYKVFLHLRDEAGQTVANGDSVPTWYIPRPTSSWTSSAPRWDAHTLSLPPGLAPGRYRLIIGWYLQEEERRLTVLGADGNPQANEFVMGVVEINPSAAPGPDLACLLNTASCDSGAG
jgi:hypothetical protein